VIVSLRFHPKDNDVNDLHHSIDANADDQVCFRSQDASSSSSLPRALQWIVPPFETLFPRKNNNNNTMDLCDEQRLLQEAVPYYIYPPQLLFSESLYYPRKLRKNKLYSNPNVKPTHHRVDARYEIDLLNALQNHPSRVDHMDQATLFILPIPFGSIVYDGGPKFNSKRKRELYQEIWSKLQVQPPFRSGKPHVLISMTSHVFSCFTTNAEQRQGLVDLYRNLSTVSVARGDDVLAARYYMTRIKKNVTDGIIRPSKASSGQGFDHHMSVLRSVTQYTFSVGLGGQANHISLRMATYRNFQNSSFFLFYHTRVSPSFCDSTPFRLAPLLGNAHNESFVSHPLPSSVGYDVPLEQWAREFSNSQFCLVIRGDTPHSHALFNAVKAGCIPVIISDVYPFYAPPFPTTLRLWDFCLFLPEREFLTNPLAALQSLQQLPPSVIQAKLHALRFAQRVMLWDHPESLFVPAFVREAMASLHRPSSNIVGVPIEQQDLQCPETCS
jgi:hypothetical protein